jgi:NADH-quinone oxidoreductase subunit G
MHHVFGTEELSVLAPGIRDRSPEACVALSREDMSRLGLKEGDAALVMVDDRAYRLRARLSAGLVPRVAGISAGLPGSPVLGLPTWARVKKAPP